MVDNLRKNRAYGVRNPLQKLTSLPIVAQRAPTTNDKNFSIGQTWINQPLDDSYILTSISNNQANWQLTNASAAGSAPISKYVVDGDGTAGYTTIQAALNAANAAAIPATVVVRPGTYTENLTLYNNIALAGIPAEITTITGTHTPPASGIFSIKGLTLTSATNIFNSAVAGTTNITVNDCNIIATNGYLFNLLNWTGNLNVFDSGSFGTDDGFVNNTGGANISAWNSSLGAGSSNAYVMSNGNVTFRGVDLSPPGTFGGTAVVDIGGSVFFGTLTTADTSDSLIGNSIFHTTTNTSIVHGSAGTLQTNDLTINNSNVTAIGGAGAGLVTLGSITFYNSTAVAGTLTLSTASLLGSEGLAVTEGTNAASGIATLAAGTVTVNTTAVTANSRIQLTHQTNAGTPDFVSVTARVAATSFTITSGNAADTSDIAWLIIEPQ